MPDNNTPKQTVPKKIIPNNTMFRNLLNQNKISRATPKKVTAHKYTVKRELHFGEESKEVAHVQETLEDLNQYYNFYPNRPSLRDRKGFYGMATSCLIWKFQLWVKLPNSHKFDKQTNEAMELTLANYLAEQILQVEEAYVREFKETQARQNDPFDKY